MENKQDMAWEEQRQAQMNKLMPVEFKGMRVLLTKQLADVYECNEQQIQQNFNNHIDKFESGKHYYLLQGEELREFKHNIDIIEVAHNVNKLYLWTERGANRHCKILDTDKAWEQFDNLEEVYFRVKDQNKIPGTYKEALLALVVAEDEKEKLQLENKQDKQIIGELKPKADYTDRILRSNGTMPIKTIAKDYGMSAQEMNNLLHDLEVQYKQGGQWFLYTKYHRNGYTHSEPVPFTRSNGRRDTKMNTKWTQKGRLFIYNLLKEAGVLPLIERE